MSLFKLLVLGFGGKKSAGPAQRATLLPTFPRGEPAGPEEDALLGANAEELDQSILRSDTEDEELDSDEALLAALAGGLAERSPLRGLAATLEDVPVAELVRLARGEVGPLLGVDRRWPSRP